MEGLGCEMMGAVILLFWNPLGNHQVELRHLPL